MLRSNIFDKIPDTTNLATTAAFNAKTNEVKDNIPITTKIATTTTGLTAVKNKTLDHSKHTTNPEFNKLKTENFAARLVQANLASKNDIDNS